MATKFITYAARVSAPRELAELMDVLVLKQENSRYRPLVGDTIINWGCSSVPQVLVGAPVRYLNHPDRVAVAINKKATLDILRAANISVVAHTDNLAEAAEWHARGSVVIQRNRLSGRQGEGILVCGVGMPPTDQGRLWTKYFNRKDEYRIHVCRGEAIDIQKKRLRTEVKARLSARDREDAAEETSASNVYRVRSYPNGWVFCRRNVVCPPRVLQESIRAVTVLGLDFGAVDIGWRRSDSVARIFEVNTAPGIEGASLDIYARELGRAVSKLSEPTLP